MFAVGLLWFFDYGHHSDCVLLWLSLDYQSTMYSVRISAVRQCVRVSVVSFQQVFFFFAFAPSEISTHMLSYVCTVAVLVALSVENMQQKQQQSVILTENTSKVK